MINEQKFVQDAQRAFWTWQGIASEAIECFGIHNLPATKKQARSCFPVNHYFSDSANFEITDEKAREYVYNEHTRAEIREVKRRMKRALKEYFIYDRERKLSEIYD
jgi:hypothetical protein